MAERVPALIRFFCAFSGARPLACAAFSLFTLASCNVADKFTSAASGGGDSSAPISLSFLESPSYNIGYVAQSTTKFVRLNIQSIGQGTATITSYTNSDSNFTFNGGSFPGTGGSCAQNINSNCSIGILFNAASIGVYSNTVTVNYSTNEGSGSISVTLSAQVTLPAALTISNAATFNYGTRVVGTQTDQTFTVSNTGGLTATLMAGSGLASPYTFKGGTYPGTGGTCGTSLASLATCTMVVTYAPTAAGASSDTILLDYNNGSSTTQTTRGVQGTGQNPASLTISDGPTYDYGSVVIGSAAVEKIFTVTNAAGVAGATAMSGSGLAAPFVFKGTTYPGTGGTCGTTLSAGASCTIVVTYTPLTQAVHTDAIDLSYHNGAITTSTSRAVQGTGTSPVTLTISDATVYDFGTRTVNTTSEYTFTITYVGTAPATSVVGTGLASPFEFKGGTYPGTGGTCGTTISADCTIVVTYTPLAAGLITDTIQIDYNNGATTTSAFRGVRGTGQNAATLTISDAATYNFGSLTAGESIDHTFSVTYAGGAPATSVNPVVLTPPYSYKGGAYPGTGGTCTTTISANCSIVVTFNPTTAGTFNQTLSLDYQDGFGAQSASRPMTAIGLSAATLTISDAPSHDYGLRALTSSTDYTLTVTNSGQTNATSVTGSGLAAPFSFKGGAYPGTGGNCAATINAGANCTIVITFNPLVASGYSDTIELDYDDGHQAQLATRTVIGTGGSVANITISDGPTYSYGVIARSYLAEKSFTVTNSGGSPATTISETTLTAPFTFKGGSFPGTGGNCTASLTNGQSCTIVVEYAPTAAASHAGTITLSYNNGVGATNATRALSGQGATITQITSGDEHTCALYSTGIVKCWGSDASGQLGDDAAFASSSTPVLVSGITNATAISAGANHSCALLSNNRIWCWGSDSDGQLGDGGANTNSGIPVQVATFTDFNLVSIGGNTSCARRVSGAAICWGDDSVGQVGNNATLADQITPVAVSGLTSAVTHISVGTSHACARRTSGIVSCWGSDSNGQLGNGGANTNSGIPVGVTGYTASGGAAAYAGGGHSCLVTTGNVLRCFGADTYGEIGNDVALADQITAVDVSGGTSATLVALGADHSCALLSGAMSCWGRDDEGQLGDNAPSADIGTPALVNGVTGVSAISTGGKHTCAVQTSGDVYCWGSDSAGQLGNGAGTASQSLPDRVQGL